MPKDIAIGFFFNQFLEHLKGIAGDGDGSKNYKCCRDDFTTSCSACVADETSNWTCVSGATLTKC
jgi:hypothetical protein